MQTLQDIHDKIFFETKSILESLSKIQSKDELLAKQDLVTELTDRIAFLRILEKNEDSFNEILADKSANNHFSDNAEILDEAAEDVKFNENNLYDNLMEEEVIFTNELNDFEEEIETEERISASSEQAENIEELNDEIYIDSISEFDLSEEKEIPLILEQEEPDHAERVAQKERELEEMEERRRTIVEFTKHETAVENILEVTEHRVDTPQQEAEKKFKLAHIKGLKVMQQLFDLDPLEDEKTVEEIKEDSGSLLKSNVKTDFMEAEKRKPEFKLDLNDKVAFSKSLFGGNDDELKSTIEKLNSFDILEDAKQYLSEVYYEKDWSRKDEFAQRLWNLVESKF